MAYNPPLALTVISAISIGVAAVFSLWILFDIVQRRGRRSMMAIMYVQPSLSAWNRTSLKTSVAQDPGLCDQCPLSMAHNSLDVPQIRETCRAAGQRKRTVPWRSQNITHLYR